jgi:hypothetical protein
LYAENNFAVASHVGNLMMHGGADVYVRDYAALTAVDVVASVRLTWLMALALLLFGIVF